MAALIFRPLTSCFFHATKTWMPGIKPGMTKKSNPAMTTDQLAIVSLTAATRSFSEKGFGRKVKRSPSGRFFLNASSA